MRGKNMQFFRSGYSAPALVNIELTVDVYCVALGGRVGDAKFEGDFFYTQRTAQ